MRITGQKLLDEGYTYTEILNAIDKGILHPKHANNGEELKHIYLENKIEPRAEEYVFVRWIPSESGGYPHGEDLLAPDVLGEEALKLEDVLFESIEVQDFHSKTINKINVAVDSVDKQENLEKKGQLEWKDVKITFVNSEMVQIEVQGQNWGGKSFEDLNLAGRGGKGPGMLWNVLHGMASNHGELDFNKIDPKDRNKSKGWMRDLRGKLKVFFKIYDSDPLPYVDKDRRWKTAFTLTAIEEYEPPTLSDEIQDEDADRTYEHDGGRLVRTRYSEDGYDD